MEKTNETKPNINSSRRHFLKDTATIVAGGVLAGSLPAKARALEKVDVIKIALIGCGARGAGAVVDALKSSPNLTLVAMADVFRDKLDDSYQTLLKIEKIRSAIKVPETNKFVGLDAYQKAIALADAVLLVTPPAFRPLHFEECVKAGKHVFMEKPLACDAPGIRRILAAGKAAEAKNLKVVVGLQNRYDPGYQEMVKKIQEGAIGRIVSATDYYLIGPIKAVPREKGQSELEYQLRNWRYFNWLWAGSPAGLQIHNTDVVNWVKKGYPVRAQGLGGRSSLASSGSGDIFDHFFIEYEYEDGMKLNSQIRHIAGTWNKGGAYFSGAIGTASLQSGIRDLDGNRIWRNSNADSEGAYQIEHQVLFDAIRNNKAVNDTEWGAMSTMTTIMGRMAAHSGKMIEWEEAMKSELVLAPDITNWKSEPPILPDKNGNYAFPVPGQSNII